LLVAERMQAAERLANLVISQARLSFGTDVPELLSLSAQVCLRIRAHHRHIHYTHTHISVFCACR